jgi:hypothetical protein
VLDAKYAIFGGLGHTPDQQAAWGAIEALANEFKSADKILISVPRWPPLSTSGSGGTGNGFENEVGRFVDAGSLHLMLRPWPT